MSELTKWKTAAWINFALAVSFCCYHRYVVDGLVAERDMYREYADKMAVEIDRIHAVVLPQEN